MDPDAVLLSLYEQYGARIYTYCVRLSGSPDDASDALQETFTAVLRRLREGARIEHPRAYLFAAARHACLARLERQRREPAVDEVPDVRDEGLGAEAERVVLTGDLQDEIRAANALLPERQREVLVLREVEELSYTEIGDLMGLHANAVAQLVWRARVNLKGALRKGALQSIAAVSEECERALTLLAVAEDRGLKDGDAGWLDDHLRDCERCTANRGAMLEAGTTYRVWAPVAAAPIAAQLLLEKAHAAVSDPVSATAGAGGDTARKGSSRLTRMVFLALTVLPLGLVLGFAAGLDKPGIPVVDAPSNVAVQTVPNTQTTEKPSTPARRRAQRRRRAARAGTVPTVTAPAPDAVATTASGPGADDDPPPSKPRKSAKKKAEATPSITQATPAAPVVTTPPVTRTTETPVVPPVTTPPTETTPPTSTEPPREEPPPEEPERPPTRPPGRPPCSSANC